MQRQQGIQLSPGSQALPSWGRPEVCVGAGGEGRRQEPHLGLCLFGGGPIRLLCVGGHLLPLALGALQRGHSLSLYLLQWKQRSDICGHVSSF